ncbi:MAG: calcium/sodium antiporter [SAR86 cluster bacterium]|jgi:cation:H+ antiporter|uniref:Calcium/sodium antiporter n=1 Tax=SAR86 cluster bacterium TaxID=2030880 RepID=A0A973A7Y2_9GAMM|nr:calcium/sodium antiporter [SAR86 cluster bacterium]|tara:strand:- start:2223 stop:3203 length:981 start_codon:yes stop_codon:yes gene_type:complete
MLAIAAVIIGIVLLVFSADKFVDGAAAAAKRAGLPPLLIGMLVIGFGSSMPEMVISGLSASQGNSGLALGNAFGSNITNIALILGLTAAISPIRVESSILRRELPLLAFVTLTAAALLYVDGALSRTDGWILIGLFVVIMAWSIRAGVNNKTDHLAVMVEQELQAPMSMARAITYVVFGLILLVISSQILVWGGVEIARALGISDLIIGLTVVAVGTSLPELAASIAAVRKNEHDLALGNIIGSNLFNTSIVIGITGTIGPTLLEPGILSRDLPVLGILTAALFLMGYAFRGRTVGIITRLEGILLLIAYVIYNAGLVLTVITTKA